jgi:hypothetical protein
MTQEEKDEMECATLAGRATPRSSATANTPEVSTAKNEYVEDPEPVSGCIRSIASCDHLFSGLVLEAVHVTSWNGSQEKFARGRAQSCYPPGEAHLEVA